MCTWWNFKRLRISVDLTIDKALQKAFEAQKAGQIQEADRLYTAILKAQPKHPEASHNLGVLAVSIGKAQDALPFFKTALEANPNIAKYWSSYINTLIQLDRPADAKTVFDQAKSKGVKVEAFDSLKKKIAKIKVASGANKANVLKELKQTNIPESNKLDQAINLAKKKAKEGLISEARLIYDEILTKFPKNNRAIKGLKSLPTKKLVKASYIQDPPLDQLKSLINLHNQGHLQHAFQQTKLLVTKFPKSATLLNIQGVLLKDLGQLDLSIEAYRKALFIKSDYAEAYNNMGVTLQEQRKLKKAIKAFNKALAIRPEYASAYYNMGNALKDQGKLEEAIEAYNRALAIKPDYAKAHNNIGNALNDQGKLKEAMASYEKTLSLKPDYARARAQKLHMQAQMCDWRAIKKDLASLKTLGIEGKSVSPFTVLSLEDMPERHRLRSERYAKENFSQKPLPAPAMPSKRPDKLRIGYFSTDYGEHPVAYLIAKVLEQHNRDEFEVFGYSLRGNQQVELRQRLINSFDRFVDVQKLSNKDVASKVRQDGIDIAIDLNGHTQYARTNIFAYRAAPIQINYLGFPGTMGADFMDYIVADRYIIPPENQKYFNEKILYLPNTYMPTDNSRKLSERHLTRGDMGLPEDAFVFCCFNNNYKITSSEFDIWMRLLNKVEGSVLWLRQSNQWSELNVKQEAQRRQVDPERVVFAGRVPMAEHLARQRLADLFIDTFSFNAHTTAAEALWAGLPVVTKTGKGFAARVAGSLLNSVGLPELITKNEHDYEILILELATIPSKLSKIRKKLAANLPKQALFDTEQYTKHIEDGYQQAYQNYFEGNAPKTITVQM